MNRIKQLRKFPSPLEVIRFISTGYANIDGDTKIKFPSPLEVIRFISNNLMILLIWQEKFPSPLEVIRFISPYLVL